MKKSLLKSCFVFSVVGLMISMSGCKLDDDTPKIEEKDSVIENTIALCSDGIDNDGNGVKDCDDPNCHTTGSAGYGPGNTVCASTEDNDYVCNDGIDNDGNGYIDCNDNSCKNGKNVTVCSCQRSVNEDGTQITEGSIITRYVLSETGETQSISVNTCMDGEDNDCNGYIDCSDNACKKSTDPEVIAYCQGQICADRGQGCLAAENTLAACSDGVDNDMNGYIDCKDKGCYLNGSAEAVKYCSGELIEWD